MSVNLLTVRQNKNINVEAFVAATVKLSHDQSLLEGKLLSRMLMFVNGMQEKKCAHVRHAV